MIWNRSFLGLIASALLVSPLTAQGPLDPPSGPQPSMIRLDQIEPRIPIAGGTSGFTVTQPGSYFLTGNIVLATGNGITIAADNVTLDLNGFTISSTANPATGFGVLLTAGRSNITISNGHIRGSTTQLNGTFTKVGFASGIDYAGPPRSTRVTGVSVSGVGNYGIDLGAEQSTLISGCTVRIASFFGLRAGSVSDSAALEIGNTAIVGGTVSNSIGTLTNGTASEQSIQPTVSSVSSQVSSVSSQVSTLQSAVTQNADPRTRIPGGGPITLSISGSYVLTGNITANPGGSAIVIAVDNVTLDLNGFTLTSLTGGGAASGVLINGTRSNVTVRNGNIVGGTTYAGGSYTDAGFFNGVFASSASRGIRIEKISVANVARGLELGVLDESSIVEDCSVNLVSSNGISAGIVRNCVSHGCGGFALAGQIVSGCVGSSRSNTCISAVNVSDSHGTTDSTNSGHSAISAITVENSTGLANVGNANGITASAATNCRGSTIGGNGFNVTTATNCSGSAGSGVAITASTATNCSAVSNGVGINATIGVSCRVLAGTTSITNKYLMP